MSICIRLEDPLNERFFSKPFKAGYVLIVYTTLTIGDCAQFNDGTAFATFVPELGAWFLEKEVESVLLQEGIILPKEQGHPWSDIIVFAD